MGFIKGTRVFTDRGWSNIEDIAGRDRVLVRNFLGEAEFIQPFALKRQRYQGEIVQIGAKNWSFSVTPEHTIVYSKRRNSGRSTFVYEKAEDVTFNESHRIYRKFKYLQPEEYKREVITFNTDFGKKWVYISNQDWFVLVAFVLIRGYISKSDKKKALIFYLNNYKKDRELTLLSDILDRIGLKWSLIYTKKHDQYTVRVTSDSPIVKRLITRLGSSKRREMFLPDKMIFQSSKELGVLLIETIIELCKKTTTDRKDMYQYATNNEKLVDSLDILATRCGYGTSVQVMHKKGVDTGKGKLHKDVLILNLRPITESYSIRSIKKHEYDDMVYEIDLFDGQVYVRQEKGMPVWVNPK